MFRLASITICFMAWAALAPALAWAGPSEQEFPDYEELPVPVSDGSGTVLKLLRLVPRPDCDGGPRPVILLAPGFSFTGFAMAQPARYFQNHCYDVFVGQPRYVQGADATVRDVLFSDYPAMLRKVLALAGGAPVHLAGHSLGGVATLVMISDPALSAEFSGKIASAVNLMAADMIYEPPTWLNMPLSSLFELTDGSNVPGISSIIPRVLVGPSAYVVQPLLIPLMPGMSKVSPRALAGFVRWGMGPISTTAFEEIKEQIDRGTPFTLDMSPGSPVLIDPARISVPILTVAADADNVFVPAERIHLLHQRIASSVKYYEHVVGMDHLTPIIADRTTLLWDTMLRFEQDPAAYGSAPLPDGADRADNGEIALSP